MKFITGKSRPNKNFKKNVLFTFILANLLLYSCITIKKSFNDVLAKEETPPNGVRVSDFYCDRTEITNFSWMEYMFWTSRTYGSKSKEFFDTKIDSMVWIDDSCTINLAKDYLRHPAYRDYPVVGISQRQANQFSKWRSDRVFEYILVREGIIEYNKSQNKENLFTISNFFNGKIERIDKIKKVEFYPEFSLPNASERKLILKFSDSLDLKYSSKYYSKNKKSKDIKIIHCDISLCLSSNNLKDPTRPVQSYFGPKNLKQIFDIRGNVSEWAKEDNITFGGNWGNDLAEIMLFDEIKASTASKYIGFRNICRFKKWVKN